MSRVERNGSIVKEKEPAGIGIRVLGRLLHAIGALIMVAVLVACLGLVIPKLAGYDGYVVVSGSMEPSIPVGSIVYSKKVDPATLRTGDVIVFFGTVQGTTPITHRVVLNDPTTGAIITKGDANANQDINPVTYDNVVGKVAAHIPRVGFAAAVFTTVRGKLAAGLILLAAWLLMEIGSRLTRK